MSFASAKSKLPNQSNYQNLHHSKTLKTTPNLTRHPKQPIHIPILEHIYQNASQPLQPNGQSNRLQNPISRGKLSNAFPPFFSFSFLENFVINSQNKSFPVAGANAVPTFKAKAGNDTGKGSASARVTSAADRNANMGYGGGKENAQSGNNNASGQGQGQGGNGGGK